jgi:hypothetical protein
MEASPSARLWRACCLPTRRCTGRTEKGLGSKEAVDAAVLYLRRFRLYTCIHMVGVFKDIKEKDKKGGAKMRRRSKRRDSSGLRRKPTTLPPAAG